MFRTTLAVALLALILVTAWSICDQLIALSKSPQPDRTAARAARRPGGSSDAGLEPVPPRAGRTDDPDPGQRVSRGEAEQYGWYFDYAHAKEVAAESRKPLMVVIRCVP